MYARLSPLPMPLMFIQGKDCQLELIQLGTSVVAGIVVTKPRVETDAARHFTQPSKNSTILISALLSILQGTGRAFRIPCSIYSDPLHSELKSCQDQH